LQILSDMRRSRLLASQKISSKIRLKRVSKHDLVSGYNSPINKYSHKGVKIFHFYVIDRNKKPLACRQSPNAYGKHKLIVKGGYAVSIKYSDFKI